MQVSYKPERELVDDFSLASPVSRPALRDTSVFRLPSSMSR
ncbi:MAG: hypothetical protein ACI8RU_000093 [Zhongshania aliphaticivorans]|jgi:hypothetical protein